MEPSARELVEYVDDSDRNPFREWLLDLPDSKERGVIRNRMNRLSSGNFGDCKSVGNGVHELRIEFGPGYRVYFGTDGDRIVVLRGGGDKSSQPSDITKAKARWSDYNA